MKIGKLFLLAVSAIVVSASVSGCGPVDWNQGDVIGQSIANGILAIKNGWNAKANAKANYILAQRQTIWNQLHGDFKDFRPFISKPNRQLIAKVGIRTVSFGGGRITMKKFRESERRSIAYLMNPTFGYSVFMLKQVALNETNTQYLQPILSVSPVESCNAFQAFLSQTQDTKVLDSMVFGYFSNGLTNQFGDIKASFLQNIGIGLETSINYVTILNDSNDFLRTIKMNDKDNLVFEVFFNKRFGNRHTIVTQSGSACLLITKESIAKEFNESVGILGGEHYKTEHYFYNQAKQLYNGLLRYQKPDLNNVNFYSVVYYLLYQIDFGHGIRKQVSKKILSDIILRHFKRAAVLFYQASKELPGSSQFLTNLQSHNTAIVRFQTAVKKFVNFAEYKMIQYPANSKAGCQKPRTDNIYVAQYYKCITVPIPFTKKQMSKLKALRTEIKLDLKNYKKVTGLSSASSQNTYNKMSGIVSWVGMMYRSYKRIRKHYKLLEAQK